MLEAQKILHLSQMNNQATREHREENEYNVGLHIFFSTYLNTKYLFPYTTKYTFS